MTPKRLSSVSALITLDAPAKLNLYLHVTGKRQDGYHLLDSLVAFLPDLCDSIILEKADQLLFDASGMVPEDAKGMDNLAVKAAKAVAESAGCAPDVHITLRKNIPAGAGLGGGSADAAAVVKGLERLWNLSLDNERRKKILLSLGADVPVCYHGKPCRLEGIGEVLSDVPSLPSFFLLLIWPDCHTSTQDVFRMRAPDFRQGRTTVPASFSDLDAFVEFLGQTGNDLQDSAESLKPPIATARTFLQNLPGCLLPRMSGSGSCVFGIYKDSVLCKAAEAAVRQRHPSWWVHTSAL